MENGKTFFSEETIDKICEFFEITPADFEEPENKVTVASYNTNNTHSNNSADSKMLDTLISLHEQNQALIARNHEITKDLLAEKDERIRDLQSRLDSK